ncbi:tRNA nucleotidyltransferase (CCA-adding enzyme) [Natronoarchaeum philippinense]|uniref:CCA-adding enzyme n=1 Tax=Natronoarchaeum philippinense TaxID=558529 RepID=A0A285NRH8_NATPI|nr:CCA tRNA nucleotidyltransferase [Natronoarchaeum philippinense]SNZ12085.1 tRNA nucleotidyltransferase (CCA-adding enzyme) [Natronoarchaeum philippinense]
MTDEEFAAVVEGVRETVDPSTAERERMEGVAQELRRRAEGAVDELPVDADVLQVGSTARNTWISGDRDIDVFVRFPTELDREELEEYGLDVGHSALPEGHEEYAEHPYVKGVVDGFDIDLVPCYDVEDAAAIRSAVDRTPFHAEYVAGRLDADLAADVRLAKQFLTGIGVYGSDLRTRGFSGYLTELLVLAYGGFREFVEAAAEWHPPVELDPEDHGDETFDDPLVVIDPTDPERNVAAVLSADNVARLQHYARDLLADPREELFFADQPAPLSDAAVEAAIAERGTTPVAIRFAAPDVVEDQLYPQLSRSLDGITEALDRRGFDVVRSTAMADETAVLLAELAVDERPAIERHEGPPVHVREHAAGFFEKYADDESAYGPFVEGERYVVERPREFETAAAFLRSDQLLDVRLGTHVASALEADHEALIGEEVASLAGEFGVELAQYFEPEP